MRRNDTPKHGLAGVITLIFVMTMVPFWFNMGMRSDTTFAQRRESAFANLTRNVPEGAYVPGRLIVKMNPTLFAASTASLFAEANITTIKQIEPLDFYVVETAVGREVEVARQLMQNPSVAYAEPDYYMHFLEVIPNDPYFEEQPNLSQIQLPEAWEITTGSADVTIAIIDSGIDLGHPDFAGKLVAGYDFYEEDNLPADEYGHGTHVASIAAGATNNGVGVAGVSWHAKIMPLRVGGGEGEVSTSAAVDAILWAADHGADVINMSIGSDFSSLAGQQAVDYAYEKGVVVVAAAGNLFQDGSPVQYPAAYEHVIGVAAVDAADQHADFSNAGSYVDVAAPGVGIWAAYLRTTGQDYAALFGTSMASPHVAGLAALIRAANPALSPQEIESIITSTAKDLGDSGRDNYFGFGRIDALAALQVAIGDLPLPTPTQTATPTITPSPVPTTEDTPIQISATHRHTCALTAGGEVRCWGDNLSGQLGDGTTIDRGSPVIVNGLVGDIVNVQAGGDHTCALNSAHHLQCWGANNFGQLGDGTRDMSFVPVQVQNLPEEVRNVALGYSFTCALTEDKVVKCWGAHDVGQLGAGDIGEGFDAISSVTPRTVSGLTNVDMIAAGYGHACALSGGSVKCWGANSFGEVGDGTTDNRTTPVAVQGLPAPAKAIIAGDQRTCAYLTNDQVLCWGFRVDENSQQIAQTTPLRVLTNATIAQLEGGAQHTLLATEQGIIGWGFNEYDQTSYTCGDFYCHTPTLIPNLIGAVMGLAAGDSHSCALIRAGAQCWGANQYGQLGAGVPFLHTTPVKVKNLPDITSMDAGDLITCATAGGGAVYCWGQNIATQIGDGTRVKRFEPTSTFGLTTNYVNVSSGEGHSCTLDTDGAAQCWGNDTEGELGSGATSLFSFVPQTVTVAAPPLQDIEVGRAFTCVLTTDNAIKCWGDNTYGQLGGGSASEYSASAVDVVGIDEEIVNLSAGYWHSCAVDAIGSIWCWGADWGGILGDGTTSGDYDGFRATPSKVISVTNASEVASGTDHTCARLNDGTVQCWGSNFYGQLGNDNQETWYGIPTTVAGLEDITAIAAGGSHTCALNLAGALYCWGVNDRGQLGDGTLVNRPMPVAVQGLTKPIVAVTAGSYHTCAIDNAGDGYCWGWNNSGQLGTGTKDRSSVPIDVVGMEPVAAAPTATPTATPILAPPETPTPTATPTIEAGASTQITPQDGATLEWERNMTVRVEFPPGAVEETGTVVIQAERQPPATGSFLLLGEIFSLDIHDQQGDPITQFDEPFTFSFTFSAAQLQGVIPDQIALYWWDDAGHEWMVVSGMFDEGTRTLTVTLDHLTTFGVFVDSPQMRLPLLKR